VKECEGWVKVLEFLESELRKEATPELLLLAAAITERSPHEVPLFSQPEIGVRSRQSTLRSVAAELAVGMLEAKRLPVDVAALSFLTDVEGGASNIVRILRVLALDSAEHGEPPILIGSQMLERHRDAFSIDDPVGTMLARISVIGPRTWRLPAMLALAPSERRRLPVLAIEQLLRDPELLSAGIERLLERDDVADLLRVVLEQRLSRHEARLVLERLASLEARPFERTPLPRLLVLATQLDPDSGTVIEEELVRRAEEAPAELAALLASSREERVRDVLVRTLAKVRYTDVPWDAADPGSEKLRLKLLALTGERLAADGIRHAMEAAMQASQTQGASESIVQDLWPYLLGQATPFDVAVFGPPSPIESLASRAAAWTDAEIRDFLTSPMALPDPGAGVIRWGSVAVVARLLGPARSEQFSDELVALWRAYVAAGLDFDALSLFGQMGRGQVTVLGEVISSGAESRSPARFNESQKLAYVSALRRDSTIHREVEPILRNSESEEIAKALARYSLEVTGYWKEPAISSTRPASAPTGPRTALDWQRVLITRLGNEGLAAIDRAEPAVIQAWEKTLRERGLLLR
jgi:hypothetical protein